MSKDKLLDKLGLTHLLEKLKATFISNKDSVQVASVEITPVTSVDVITISTSNVDSTPTKGSKNLVTSGGVYDAIPQVQDTSNKLDKVSKSTDNAIVRFDGTSGNIQNSGVTIDDSNLLYAPSVRIGNTIYCITNIVNSGSPVEIILYTGMIWRNFNFMPVLHFTGYAYGKESPVEFKVGLYIYSNKIGWCGVTNMGSWAPDVYLFKYTKDEVDYVAVGLSDTSGIYFPSFSVDVQSEAISQFSGTVTDKSFWTWEFNTTAKTIPEPDGGVSCIKVPYKSNVLGKAIDLEVVHLTGNETISGNKTFTNGIILNIGNSWTSSDRTIPFSADQAPANIRYVNNNSNTGLTYNPATGGLKAASFIKRGGTSSQFLKADGSVDSSTYLTSHQDISIKADKKVPASSGNVATLDSTGNLADSGFTLGKSVPASAIFTDYQVTAPHYHYNPNSEGVPKSTISVRSEDAPNKVVTAITTDERGHVTSVSGDTLSFGDLSSHPTTISDYGITDIPPIRSYTNVTGIAAVTTGSYYATRYDVEDATIKEYVDGMIVHLRVPAEGNFEYGTAFQINSLGYKPIVYDVRSAVGNRYSAGSTLILTYNANQIGSLYLGSTNRASITGCWQIMDSDYKDEIQIFKTDMNYQYKDFLLYPISHPDISTDAKLLPQRYIGNKQVFEKLIPLQTQHLESKLAFQYIENLPTNVTVIKYSVYCSECTLNSTYLYRYDYEDIHAWWLDIPIDTTNLIKYNEEEWYLLVEYFYENDDYYTL